MSPAINPTEARMGRLDGKTAVILGGDAIGAGVARRFAHEGARVAVLDLSQTAADAAVAGIPGGVAVRLDALAMEAAFVAVGEQLGPVQVLVNNPLPPPVVAPLESQAPAAFAEAFDTVRLAALAMQAAFPQMRAQGWGRIVNIGHRYGECVGEAIAPYNAAAWALVGLTRTAALDWGRWQIATNLLVPFAETPELERARERRPKVIDLLVGQTPLKRAGDPEKDIGAAAAFLACDESSFVNGQVIYADGGQHVAAPVLNPARFAG
jgi:NAD(P)-dependent dehydrogenase (short-subunit alcohol dehydrogenase family)